TDRDRLGGPVCSLVRIGVWGKRLVAADRVHAIAAAGGVEGGEREGENGEEARVDDRRPALRFHIQSNDSAARKSSLCTGYGLGLIGLAPIWPAIRRAVG